MMDMLMVKEAIHETIEDYSEEKFHHLEQTLNEEEVDNIDGFFILTASHYIDPFKLRAFPVWRCIDSY